MVESPRGTTLAADIDRGIERPPRPDDDREATATNRSRLRRPLGVLALVIAGGLVGAVTVRAFSSTAADDPSPVDVGATIEAALAEAADADPEAVAVYRAILPSLVFIEVERDPPASDAASEDPDAERSRIGSGVVVNGEGEILTANHVIDGATRIAVSYADGTAAEATVVEQDPANDIAVLRTSQLPEVIVPAVFGASVQIGDDAFAVANPLGLTASLTAGVISGLGRTIPLDDGATLDGLIQFDAAVNPGSSGGPLLNDRGQVVGIITALANPAGTDNFSGIGFAVPIQTAGGTAGGPSQ